MSTGQAVQWELQRALRGSMLGSMLISIVGSTNTPKGNNRVEEDLMVQESQKG